MVPDTRIYFDPAVTDGEAFKVTKDQEAKEILGKISKLIPGEILGAYGAGLVAIPTFDASLQPAVGIIWFVLGMVGTAWYVGWRIGKGFERQKHIFAYVWAFALWAYALSGKTALPWIYHPGIATLLLAVTSLVFAKMKFPAKERR